MLDPKEKALLELAERGEAPSDLYWPSMMFIPQKISRGKLTTEGETALKVHRWEEQELAKEKAKQVDPKIISHNLEYQVSYGNWSFTEEAPKQEQKPKLHKRVEKLEERVSKLEKPKEPHDCCCRQCQMKQR